MPMEETKKVAIIGAGISGLVACKYTLEKKKHLNPIVFEAQQVIGGVWAHTLESTKLQSAKYGYEFSDFPWPPRLEARVPTHDQVLDYVESYARHFGLYPYIQFNSRVIGLDYVGGEREEEMEGWGLWGGDGTAFGSRGRWRIRVQDTKSSIVKNVTTGIRCHFIYNVYNKIISGSVDEENKIISESTQFSGVLFDSNSTTEVHYTQDYEAEFVILCIGQFSGLPNIPSFPPNEGPQVFRGKVLHSEEYSFMDKSAAKDMVRDKKIAVFGSGKSAVDLAFQCATLNGNDNPCTLIKRTVYWDLPIEFSPMYGHFFLIRFFNDMFNRKPGETFLQSIVPTLFSPMRGLLSKVAEIYLSSVFPLKKYGMVPKTRFIDQLYSCRFAWLPDGFYDRVEEGSLVLKKAQGFSFVKEGLLLDGDETRPLEVDVVVFATGFRGDEKLRDIFMSQKFREMMMGSSHSSLVPLYRHIIHPRIPRLAVIGYAETISNLCTSELRSQWLAQLLDNKIKLPTVSQMEKNVQIWNSFNLDSAGKLFTRPCISTTHFWYNDQLCKDMGHNPTRKKGFFANLFRTYLASDYAGLASS